jgi:hypothetical protein
MVSLAPLVARVDACALCSVGPEHLGNAVIVRNASGATLEFVACDRCAAAVRRLIAAAGGATASGPAQIVVLEAQRQSVQPAVDAATADLMGLPVLIHEFAEPFAAEDGRVYSVRVWGQERSDGTWIGWLAFVTRDGQVTRATPRETSQSSREHLAYWATGLENAYLEGAFRRTQE